MTNVKAKFRVTTVTLNSDYQDVNFAPVIADSDENKTWSKYTPAGSLRMIITNPDIPTYTPGDDYILTFEKV